jgi:hypothetical protein
MVHFLAVKTDEHIALKASVTMKTPSIAVPGKRTQIKAPGLPVQALRMLNAYRFGLKLIGLDRNQNEIYTKILETDSFGNLTYKIPLIAERSKIEVFQVYEIKKNPGLELLLGSYIPLVISSPKKLIICDFDKTLVDTKYSSTREVYYSLTKPLEYFPTVTQSLNIVHDCLGKNFHPFVLSASPHFYEEAMRDWLYQNQIYTAGIFLKDYRKIFSFLDWDLSPKDLKVQGLYKLNHLLDILLMTGIPDSLVLVGDNFESDPIIYLTLARLLKEQSEPWALWNELKRQDAFRLNRKQNAQFLNKIYQLSGLITRRKEDTEDGLNIDLKIYIRKKSLKDSLDLPQDAYGLSELFTLYDGYPKNSGKQNTRSKEKDIADAKIEP